MKAGISTKYNFNRNHYQFARVSSRSGYWESDNKGDLMPYLGGVVMAVIIALMVFFSI